MKKQILLLMTIFLSTSCTMKAIGREFDVYNTLNEDWDLKLDRDKTHLINWDRYEGVFDQYCNIIAFICDEKPKLYLSEEKNEKFGEILAHKMDHYISFLDKFYKVYSDDRFTSDMYEGYKKDYSWFYCTRLIDYDNSYGESGIRNYDPEFYDPNLKNELFVYYVDETNILYVAEERR